MVFVKILITVLLLQTVCLSSAYQYRDKLKLSAKWNEMVFKFPANYLKESALEDQTYIPGNSEPMDVDVWYGDNANPKVFITIPKFSPGIPVTLGFITPEQGSKAPKLQPYPDYSWHWSNGTDCDGITSVLRIFIDTCDRLWVLDSGRIQNYQACQPQLLAFDLQTDELVHRYRIPRSQYYPGRTQMSTPIVDIRDSPDGSCANTMIYMADSQAFGLVVYDLLSGLSWRFENRLMGTDPQFETFTISGQSFVLQRGIAGLALSPKYLPQSRRLLYFHGHATDTEAAVPLSFLDDKRNWVPSPNGYRDAFVELGARGVQSISEAMDRYGNLFFGICGPNAIVCWDSTTPYIKPNLIIVDENERRLQFAGGVKTVTNPYGKEELWVLTNRYQKFATGTLNSNEVNFRVLYIPIEELLVGTKCVGPSMD